MHIGAAAVFAAVRRGISRPARAQWFGAALIAPLVLLLAVGASAPPHVNARSDNGITPLAAVAQTGDESGVQIVAATRPLPLLRIAAASVSAPPPPVVVNSPGSLRIPAMALSAYRNAERMMAAAYPACGVSWNLLAGIGRIESLHANGGATDSRGTPISPIYGPALDGTLPGNEVIVQSVQSGRANYARALGPMQFLPGTWARYASDGDGDGKADVQNLYDSTLAAARYLCSGNLNLRNPSQVMGAILRYNNSTAYASNVLGWAAAYATGVVPVDLPPITGPAPLGDAHLDANPEGLGPGLPLSAVGLPADDPLALIPLLGPGRPDLAGQVGVPGQMPGPAMGPLPGPAPEPVQNCAVFCIQGTPPATTPEAPPPAIPGLPPFLLPPPPAAPFGPPPAQPGLAVAPPAGLMLPAGLVPGPPPGPPPGPALAPADGAAVAPAASPGLVPPA